MKILLIEDDPQTASYVAKGFSKHGHSVELATEGRHGLFLCTSGQFDLVIVDRRLPGMDGLEAGGDDYLVKPFHFSELLARANALMRRPPISVDQTVLRLADLEMNLLQR